jgi:hypothetical protein
VGALQEARNPGANCHPASDDDGQLTFTRDWLLRECRRLDRRAYEITARKDMGSGRTARISELYQAALAHRREDRAVFLKEACADDDTVREEVESLLRYEGNSPEFLESPPAALAEALPGFDGTSQMPGRDFGPYLILAPLGKAGRGEVYRARDTRLDREVALKFLPPHFIAEPERRARFAREARLLATLNHPHIGAIYGVEEADGAPHVSSRRSVTERRVDSVRAVRQLGQ